MTHDPAVTAVRFQRRMDTDELCCAEYRGHTIDCTADWRRRGVWHCMVRNKAGELVAEHRREGHDRRGMLLESACKAELLPNNADDPRPSPTRKL